LTTRGTISPKHRHVGLEQAEPARGIVAVGGAARLLVHAGGDDHQTGALEVVVIAIRHGDERRERYPVVHIDRHGFGARTVAVEEDHLPNPGAQSNRHCGCRTDRTDADDADLHGEHSFQPGGSEQRRERALSLSDRGVIWRINRRDIRRIRFDASVLIFFRRRGSYRRALPRSRDLMVPSRLTRSDSRRFESLEVQP